MDQLVKIAVVLSEIEAHCLQDELEERGIPYLLRDFHDSVYDGLFQLSKGWGRVDAPEQYKEEIVGILEAIRERAAQAPEDDGEDAVADEDGCD